MKERITNKNFTETKSDENTRSQLEISYLSPSSLTI